MHTTNCNGAQKTRLPIEQLYIFQPKGPRPQSPTKIQWEAKTQEGWTSAATVVCHCRLSQNIKLPKLWPGAYTQLQTDIHTLPCSSMPKLSTHQNYAQIINSTLCPNYQPTRMFHCAGSMSSSLHSQNDKSAHCMLMQKSDSQKHYGTSK